MNKIVLPQNFNYIAAFLTFACNLRCEYCINRAGTLTPRRVISGKEWIRVLNRFQPPANLPITLQGGEPTTHPDFLEIVNGVREDISLDLLTNLQFNISKFTREIDPARLRRYAKYASIRVSYHHGQMDFGETIRTVLLLMQKGYSIGIWEIDHPSDPEGVRWRQKYARNLGIDYRLKDFLGTWKGVSYGRYMYPDAVNSLCNFSCLCRGSELLIAPDASVHRCHADLYSGCSPAFNLLDVDSSAGGEGEQCLPGLGVEQSCLRFGSCNPCDIKVKTNRFQEFGHCSVEIKNISPIPSKPDVK